jgi:succinylglutamate desuccinylase
MKNDPFEKFLEALEELIDARDDAWIEEENCNYKHMQKITEERIEPAKQRMRGAFNAAVRAAINDYPAVQKQFFMEQ